MAETTDGTATGREPLYIVITECLQNDLFSNPGCRLALPGAIAQEMLLGKEQSQLASENGGAISSRELSKGPLGLFLEATVAARRRGEGAGKLHVVNIRDWHLPGPSYDDERRLYGPHCEQGTWGARYIEGLTHYLDPDGSGDEANEPFEEGTVRIHHIRADSVFDFRPRHDAHERTDHARFVPSQLDRILDELIKPHVESDSPSSVYVAVIGVHTDIKVELVLVGLRTRYELPNLAVSDTLTASRTRERHLAGLDFIDKVLKVEVITGINDLVRFLGSAATIENETELIGRTGFSRYRSYFADKQNVLAYEDDKLQQYLTLTEQRSIRVYELIRRANTVLLIWGSLFLGLAFASGVVKLVKPDVAWELPVASGAVGLLAIVAAFYSRPIRQLQENLNNLAVFRMILESRSLKTAFTRFHLTTPETLRELETSQQARAATRQIEALRAQLELISQADAIDYEALARLGFHTEENGARAKADVPEAAGESA